MGRSKLTADDQRIIRERYPTLGRKVLELLSVPIGQAYLSAWCAQHGVRLTAATRSAIQRQAARARRKWNGGAKFKPAASKSARAHGNLGRKRSALNVDPAEIAAETARIREDRLRRLRLAGPDPKIGRVRSTPGRPGEDCDPRQVAHGCAVAIAHTLADLKRTIDDLEGYVFRMTRNLDLVLDGEPADRRTECESST